jgi:peptide chain release factor 2
MAIATRMTHQIRSLNQAVRNAGDAISLIQTAEGATNEITDMLQRMRELSIQAVNDTNDNAQRSYLDLEFQQLKQQIVQIADNTELFDMSKSDNDESGLITIEEDTQRILSEVEKLEFRRMFNNPADPLNAFLDIQAGAGGTEACDWASMLLRQYLKYAERKGFKATLEDESAGDVAGIKGATLKIEGEYAFGLLRTETGVHRLVRKSPFDSAGGRHTSFASVFVYPEVDDSIEIDINPSDVRVDTYRASGSGGQHVNKTDSAVRITHLPTGVVVTSSEKSQHQNRAKAMKVLKARLYDMQRSQLDAERAEARKSQVGSGDRSERIRTYNFPQGRVTDHRINLTLYALPKVLEGEDIDELIEALIAEDQAERLAALEQEFQ